MTVHQTFQEAIDRACQEPTLLDALTWISVWECNRAAGQIIENVNSMVTPMSTAAHGELPTCFRFVLGAVMEKWERLASARGRC